MKKFFQDRKRFFYLVSPALIGGIFLILCFLNLNQSVSSIESQNIYYTHFDFSKITELTSTNAYPPLYYFVLKIWAHICGNNIATMRLLSAIFCAIALVFAFLWLKYKYGSTVAILSTFMMSISPILIHFGQEISPIAMLIAIVFASTFILQLAIDSGKNYWWILYAFLVIVGMTTHYFAILAFLAHFIYLAFIYRQKLFHQKFVYIFLLPILIFMFWVFAPNHDAYLTPELSITSIADFWTEATFYEQGSGVSNWLVIPNVIITITAVLLTIRYRKKLILLSCMVAVPVLGLIILSLPPMSSIFQTQFIAFAQVSINVLAGVALVLYGRDKFSQKRKRSKKLLIRHPEIAVIPVVIVIVSMPFFGLVSVLTKGNYDFTTNQKPTIAQVFTDITTLDRGENLSIIATTPEIYYGLSSYESYHHDVHFADELFEPDSVLQQTYFGRISDLDKFLGSRDSIWLIGEKVENDTLSLPRENWRVASIANTQYDDAGKHYQILKLEKE
jgi:4-amino-4-deoxy-L-arabinose transferase-like glycosyltransferase